LSFSICRPSRADDALNQAAPGFCGSGEFRDPKDQKASPPVETGEGPARAKLIVKKICKEAIEAAAGDWRMRLSDSPRWTQLKDESEDLQIAVMMAALALGTGNLAYPSNVDWRTETLCKAILQQTLRRNPVLSGSVLEDLIGALIRQKQPLEYGLPPLGILGAVETFARTQPLGGRLRSLIKQLKLKAIGGMPGGQRPNKFARQLAQRIDDILSPISLKRPDFPKGPFAEAFLKWFTGEPAHTQARWIALARYCADAGNKSRPSGKWLSGARAYVAEVGETDFVDRLSAALEVAQLDPVRTDDSLDILKGMIWLSATFDREGLPGALGRFTERCFRKTAGVGAASVKLGNAAVWALSAMDGPPAAAAELFRLREKVKYPSVRRLIDKRLTELADKSGKDLQSLEDVSAPTFGLDATGALTRHFPGGRAEARISALAVEVTWFNDAGKQLKGIPASVRDTASTELAEFRRLIAGIEAARAGQVTRLEQSWLEGRAWSFADCAATTGIIPCAGKLSHP